MNSDNIKYVLREFVARKLPPCRSRARELPTGTGKVIGLSGLRRTGKTFLLFDTIRRLEAAGVDRRNLLYLNFEDDRLQPLRPEELDLILRGWNELFPELTGSRVYLFLDEVQSAPGWERWVRRVQDTADAEIFVTGSSSTLLARDLTAALRGRSVTIEVFPLSFREFLAFRDIVVVPHSAAQESRIRHALETYLQWGGFPELVLASESMRPLILEEYAALMLFRDLVERYGVRNEPLMRYLLRHCFRNTASLLNVNKLHRDIASQGLAVGKNTLHDYLGHVQDAMLVFLLPKCETSLRKQAHNPKKLHAGDPGLIGAYEAVPRSDLGHRLETAVFLELRRRRKGWMYAANGAEIDLCAPEGTEFFNVCWSLTEADTRQRESAAMAEGFRRWPRAQGRLLYHESAPRFVADLPYAVPAWKFLAGLA
jgi:predicted AAA+ superfamily ATPase